MSEAVKNALVILLNDLVNLGEDKLTKAYTVGKSYAAAKSGIDVGSSMVDTDFAYRTVNFNSNRLDVMLKSLDAEIMAINPGGFDDVAAYMAEIERVFDKYANRVDAWTHYSEQAFFDGFVQGSKEIKPELAQAHGVPEEEMGFFWRTAEDEKVCETCSALDGEWFPVESIDVAWSAHIGCRCPEFFEYGARPR